MGSCFHFTSDGAPVEREKKRRSERVRSHALASELDTELLRSRSSFATQAGVPLGRRTFDVSVTPVVSCSTVGPATCQTHLHMQRNFTRAVQLILVIKCLAMPK